MYEEGPDFYLGSTRPKPRSKEDEFDFWTWNILVLEFVTVVIVCSAIILLGQYIYDRFRRVSNSQAY